LREPHEAPVDIAQRAAEETERRVASLLRRAGLLPEDGMENEPSPAEVLLEGLVALARDYPELYFPVPELRGGVAALSAENARLLLQDLRLKADEGLIPRKDQAGENSTE
jgi:hypothetical protein